MVWRNDVLHAARKIKESGMTWEETAEVISEDYQISVSGNALRKAIARRDEISLLIDTLPPPTPKQFPGILTLPEDNVLVVGDLHLGHYDRDFLKVALRTAEQYQCRGIVIPGDFFDGSEYSTHVKDDPNPVAFKTELEIAGKVLRVLGNLPWVEYIAFTQGNHDARIFKKLNSYLGMETLIHAAIGEEKIKAKILCTDRDYLYHGTQWAFGHLSSYSKVPGALAFEQAKKHKRNFAVGHDHLQGLVGDENYVGISIGSCLVEDSQFYKERRLHRFGAFVNGFLIVAENRPYLYNKQGLHPMCGKYV